MGGQNGTSDVCTLTPETLNPKILKAQYAVRGEIVARAQEIVKELAEGKKFPFDKVVFCNIGNPQQLGQVPISFVRQVLALCDYPQLLDSPLVGQLFPADVISRATEYLSKIRGGTGAYTESAGADICRQHVAEGIAERDGFPCNKDDIFISDGASQGVHAAMKLLIRDENDGILVPIPQYPLYSATLTMYGGALVPYYLDEATNWGMDVDELKRQTIKARGEGKNVRALVVINPGNPTGQVLSKENMREVLKFCQEESILLMADEVYQSNVYATGKKFNSFKKVLREMGSECEDVGLMSMHSTSKGFLGECGRRGGYTEVVGVHPGVKAEIIKLASINLCPNVNGQICTALMMKPPKEGDASYGQYAAERDGLLASLARRSKALNKVLNELEGVTCQELEGAMYAFPRIVLPKKAAEAAAEAGKAPDFLYCKQLLEETGIVCVPGSGFLQEPGTFHFRTTFLPSEEDIGLVCERLTAFHKAFLEKYAAVAVEV